jgi:energy-coupling factor transporter ATP-binding protein EcfA2
MKNVEKTTNKISKLIKQLLKQEQVIAYRTADSNYWCDLKKDEAYRTFHIQDEDLVMELRLLFKERFDKRLNNPEIALILEELKISGYNQQLKYNLQSRISYNKETGELFYKLDEESGIWIYKGKCELIYLPMQTFKRSSDFAPQVEPEFDKVNHKNLLALLIKYFNVQEDNEVILLAFYLISSLAGDACLHPVLIIFGSMGSGKSQALRFLQRLIDPKKSNLLVMPKTMDDFAIRLHNNHFVALDNLIGLRKDVSSLISMAVTGGTYTKRALYTDASEVEMDISNKVIALNGIEIVAQEADVLDRSILIKMARLNPKEIKADGELFDEFEQDISQILGICFEIVARVLVDEEPVEGKKTRLASFYEFSVKAARVMGLSDEKAAEVLWTNQKNLNIATLADNTVAQCIRILIEKRGDFKGSVTELLGIVQEIGAAHNIDKRMLPNSPQHLSRRLNCIKVNLELEYSIYFFIKNVGAFRQVTLYRK